MLWVIRTADNHEQEETVRQTVARAALVTAVQIKRFAIALSIVAALALASVALAGGTLAGKYTTKITSPPEFKGTWVLNLAQGGAYTVALNGKVFIRGKFSTTGSRITFGPETGSGCSKSGKYTWKKLGKTLRFTRISESPLCAGRSAVLARPFTQQR